MSHLILILCLTPPFLAVATYFMLVDRPFFWRTIAAHGVIFACYMSMLHFFSQGITGHDEYGLERLTLTLLIIVAHIILGFIHGLYIRRKYKRQE